MPAARRRGRGRAARAGLGGPRAEVVGRPRDGPEAGAGAGAAAAPCARALRRRNRRLSGPSRPRRGASGRPRSAGRVQPARLALGHAGGGSRPFPHRLGGCARASRGRPARAPGRGSGGGGHGGARRLPRAARRAAARAGCRLLRRRRGAALPAGLVAEPAAALRREAHPAPRPRDDPRSRAPSARPAPPRRRQRPARAAPGAAPGERGVGAVDPVRAAPGRAARGCVCARHLRRRASCSSTERARCSCRPATPTRSRTRCGG